MRRRPEESIDADSTQVFSSDSWSNTGYSTFSTPSDVDLSKYAAPAIPEGNTRNARTARYAPSAHSSYYEESGYVTNSTSDPFQHAAYDGSIAPAPQNARVDEMPSPVRRSRLGENLPSVHTHEIAHTTQPVSQAPQTQTLPVHPPQFVQPTAPVAQPIQPPAQPYPLAPQNHVDAPPAPSQPVAQVEQTEIPSIEEEIPLSDFEQEFMVEKTQSIQEDVIDLTKEVPTAHVDTQTSFTPVSQPTGFFAHSTIPGQQEISYSSGDDFFNTVGDDLSIEDRLYRDPREPRDTIQLDIDWIKGLFSKITPKVIVVVLVAITLMLAAYFITKPSSEPENAPANIQNPAGKTVVEENSDAPAQETPKVTVTPTDQVAPPVAVPGEGPIVTYDENGNPVYSSPANQNFNGD